MLETGIGGDLNVEQMEFVGTIRQKGEHLLALISSLLDMNKLEQGTMRLNRKHMDAGALVTDLQKTLTPSALKKGVQLVTEIEPEIGNVFVDPVRINQVLFNLAENALKFTPKGGVVRFTARATELVKDADDFGASMFDLTETAVEIGIIDSGIGIPKVEHDKIFDAFYQVDGSSTREHGGTGLGLSIVKRIIDAHGGNVRVESEPGQGASFFITLPRDASNDG
jgi:signal transduction histidine kinase